VKCVTARNDWKPSELGKIPPEWQVHEIVDFEPFITSGSRGWARYYSESGSPFIRITNLSHDDIYLDLRDLRFVSVSSSDAEAQRTAIQAGDVLISITADIGAIGYVGPDMLFPAYINQHIACVRFPANTIDSRYVAYFLTSTVAQRRFKMLLDVGAKTGLNLTTVSRLKLICPPLPEQEAIADSLSDVDALIQALERLLAKKHAIKVGAMQELLSGRRRLPGFSGPWLDVTLGDIAHIKTGSRNNQDKVTDGSYPFFVRSEIVERIDTFSYDCEAILVPGEGGIGSIFHYVNGRFDAHQRVYVISRFVGDVVGRFIHFYMKQYFGQHAMRNTVKATVDSLRLPTFQKFPLHLPADCDEQQAIAGALVEIDEELKVVTNRLTKARQIKEGMMQELLTGRARLV